MASGTPKATLPELGEEATFAEVVGHRIRARRLELGFSSRVIGEPIKNSKGNPVPDSQILVWERGQRLPARSYWGQLAVALETDIDELFAGAPLTLTQRVESLEETVETLIAVLGLDEEVTTALRAKLPQHSSPPT